MFGTLSLSRQTQRARQHQPGYRRDPRFGLATQHALPIPIIGQRLFPTESPG